MTDSRFEDMDDAALDALREVCEAQVPDEHVLHLPETGTFTVQKGYDYLQKSRVKTFFMRVFWDVAELVVLWIDVLFLGLRIEGQENLRPLRHRGFVSVSNHVHAMDCTAVALALANRRVYSVTLESNFRIPGVRHLIRALGGVPLPHSVGCMQEFVASMRTAIAEGNVVQICPEAVLLPYAQRLRPFHKGAFTIASSIGAPVLPLAVTFRKPRGIYALYKRKPCMTLRILPPIYANPELSSGASARDMRLRTFCAMHEAISD